jgi:hypothetical protein
VIIDLSVNFLMFAKPGYAGKDMNFARTCKSASNFIGPKADGVQLRGKNPVKRLIDKRYLQRLFDMISAAPRFFLTDPLFRSGRGKAPAPSGPLREIGAA